MKLTLSFDFESKDMVQMLQTKPADKDSIPFKLIGQTPDGNRQEITYWITNWKKIKGAEFQARVHHGRRY